MQNSDWRVLLIHQLWWRSICDFTRTWWLWRLFWWQGMTFAEVRKWVKWHSISYPENYRGSVTFTGPELIFLGRPTQVSIWFFCSSKLSRITLWKLQLFIQIVLVCMEIISLQIKDFIFWELEVHLYGSVGVSPGEVMGMLGVLEYLCHGDRLRDLETFSLETRMLQWCVST